MQVRFYWDFFGPRAADTARHFEKHLGEFLEEHGLALPRGIQQGGEGHWYAYCDPPDLPRALLDSLSVAEQSRVSPPEESVADRIARTLRPKRVLER